MKLRKQDWFRGVVSLMLIVLMIGITPDYVEELRTGHEEMAYYILFPFIYLISIGFTAGTLWEIWMRNK